jgi:hypothetical protein
MESHSRRAYAPAPLMIHKNRRSSSSSSKKKKQRSHRIDDEVVRVRDCRTSIPTKDLPMLAAYMARVVKRNPVNDADESMLLARIFGSSSFEQDDDDDRDDYGIQRSYSSDSYLRSTDSLVRNRRRTVRFCDRPKIVVSYQHLQPLEKKHCYYSVSNHFSPLMCVFVITICTHSFLYIRLTVSL